MNIEERLVSGAPSEVYALAGSLFEFHEAVMNPDRAEEAGIECLFELFGSAYYRHTATLDMMVDADHPWSTELLKSYNSERHCHSTASVVLRINDAIIENSIVHCKTPKNIFVLYESFRFPDRAANSLSPDHVLEVDVADFQQENRTYLYIGSAGSFNYGHWLVDDLPRAKAWLELREKCTAPPIIILPSFGQKMDEVRVESLKMLISPEIEVQFIPPNRPCRIRNLLYVTPVSFHPRIKNPAAIHFIQSRASSCTAEFQRNPNRKLFVARRPPNSRSVVNFDELWTFLADRGFEAVEAEKLDFSEQVALFQSAEIVVGQMGAAMTNTLFCRPATSLIYLTPIGWAEPFYLDLAAVGAQHYNVLAGPSASEGPAHLSDFTLPVDHLHHRLAYMGFK